MVAEAGRNPIPSNTPAGEPDWSTMYSNVIVAYDGSLNGRVVLAPAADLAWRCDARLVMVSNTEASEKASKGALKSVAQQRSGADIDFWVDTSSSVGRALLDAAKHRESPIICLSAHGRSGGLLRRPSLPAVAEEVLSSAECPVLVIGPKTDTSRGLPMTELALALDGSTNAEEMLPMAVAWARTMRLRLLLVGVVPDQGGGTHESEQQYLDAHVARVVADVPEVAAVLVPAPDPATGLVRFLEEHEDAVMAMSTHGRSGAGRGPLGAVATDVVNRSPRAVLLARPTSA